eukprot:scaffold4737_cov371-Prasinococcus_capsulatus_cf.AAC.11
MYSSPPSHRTCSHAQARPALVPSSPSSAVLAAAASAQGRARGTAGGHRAAAHRAAAHGAALYRTARSAEEMKVELEPNESTSMRS